MKWVTREKVKVDRVACPWLISRFVDPNAEFLFVPADRVAEVAKREGAIPYDVPGVELGHVDGHCSFEAFIVKYQLEDEALLLLAKIVHGADCSPDMFGMPEAVGLRAVAGGFALMGLKDNEVLKLEFPVYDALYLWCKQQIQK